MNNPLGIALLCFCSSITTIITLYIGGWLNYNDLK